MNSTAHQTVAENHVRHMCLLGSSKQSELVSRFLSARAFADRQRYALFLKAQYRIAKDLAALYRHPLRIACFPGLMPLDHLERVAKDLYDLRQAPPSPGPEDRMEAGAASPATMCGWLFVAEGTRLMLPYFRKQAGKLGMTPHFGAHHLVCDSAGIQARWSSFVSEANAMRFSPADLRAMVVAAGNAMERIDGIIDHEMGGGETLDWTRPALHA